MRPARDARRVLSEPYAWDALKRCIKERSIAITSLAERISLFSTTSLEPDSIPLDIRVVLIGDRVLHALLVMFDPDFQELFKVQADFEESVTRSDESLGDMACCQCPMRRWRVCWTRPRGWPRTRRSSRSASVH